MVVFFNISLVGYLLASIVYFVQLVYRRQLISNIAMSTVIAGFISHTLVIALRSQATGHGPYTTSFEVAVFFAWVLAVIFLFANWKYQIKDLGAFVVPVIFLVFLYATFLSREVVAFPDTEYQALLTLHRTLSILGYAALAMAFAVGCMYLIQEQQVKSKKLGMMFFRMPSLETLDNLNSRVISIGFPLFTLGFITGTMWNMEMTQHSIFSLNMIKVWPFIAGWLIYGLVFFGRLFVGLRGKRAAQFSMAGFATVMLTYFLHV
ncbi:MAG: cytochrome c biogenesis protein CcsA [Candidatus Nitronauta litoralis]|uniref:Cytochrome c biogenesis protein CcsA n=1 Tax=Candidatus Nitronauta litoralis TaxID=2705533 RepID=A0A7T0BZI6_9BACT|nr:MAG: cytochrome c biogenesis protein CcsA [Candidatus Nitronauta litoralis]